MSLGLSGDDFGNLLLLLAAVGIGTGAVIIIVAKHRGVDVNSHRFIVTLGLTLVLIFGGIPFWLTDLDIVTKSWGTALALAVGTLNYFGIEGLRKALRLKKKQTKSEGEEDKP